MVVPRPEPSLERRKAAIADSITGLEGVLVSDYGSSSIWALNPSESRARDQLLDLWDRSGEYNLRFQELKRAGALPNSPAECPRKWVLSKLEKFTDDQLRAPCRARSRWESWHSSRCPWLFSGQMQFLSFTSLNMLQVGPRLRARFGTICSFWGQAGLGHTVGRHQGVRHG